jgi:hypothetical protein
MEVSQGQLMLLLLLLELDLKKGHRSRSLSVKVNPDRLSLELYKLFFPRNVKKNNK